MVKKIILICVISFFSIKSVKAHNPLSAVYYLEVKDGFGILNISLSQVGFQNALLKYHVDIQLDSLSSDAYKKLAISYLKEHFNLKINDQPIDLLKGGLKLGNHQTNVKFVTSTLPKHLEHLTVTINAFEQNKHHQTIFSLSQKGLTDKLILSEKNNFSANASFENYKMIRTEKKFNKSYL